jgi:putative sigma-54 modulation protein
MQLQLTGQNIEITESLREFTSSKFQKLVRHTDRITNAHVVLAVNKLIHSAEAKLHIPGAELHAHAESDDMHRSILDLIDKLLRQIEKHKDKH